MGTSFREKLYNYISDYIGQYGQSPSFSEITQGLEISPRSKSLITRSLRVLENEGKVILTKDGRRLLISLASKHLPLLGKISAGLPIEAISECQFIDVSHFFQGSNQFALQVKGTSMIEEGILDGDIIICRESHIAHERDIVVALIDQHSATLKRISYKVNGMITLIPANPELKPRAYAPERVQIQGVYVGLIRTNR
jgi:repressor LexA